LKYFDAKLRFTLLASLRSAIIVKFNLTINWSFYPQGLSQFDKILRLRDLKKYYFLIDRILKKLLKIWQYK